MLLQSCLTSDIARTKVCCMAGRPALPWNAVCVAVPVAALSPLPGCCTRVMPQHSTHQLAPQPNILMTKCYTPSTLTRKTIMVCQQPTARPVPTCPSSKPAHGMFTGGGGRQDQGPPPGARRHHQEGGHHPQARQGAQGGAQAAAGRAARRGGQAPQAPAAAGGRGQVRPVQPPAPPLCAECLHVDCLLLHAPHVHVSIRAWAQLQQQ